MDGILSRRYFLSKPMRDRNKLHFPTCRAPLQQAQKGIREHGCSALRPPEAQEAKLERSDSPRRHAAKRNRGNMEQL